MIHFFIIVFNVACFFNDSVFLLCCIIYNEPCIIGYSIEIIFAYIIILSLYQKQLQLLSGSFCLSQTWCCCNVIVSVLRKNRFSFKNIFCESKFILCQFDSLDILNFIPKKIFTENKKTKKIGRIL